MDDGPAAQRISSTCVIQVFRLTLADAEVLIASLWRALEEHGVPSPKLNVYEAGELLDLCIEFLSEQDCDKIRRCVPHLTQPSVILTFPSRAPIS